MDVAEFHLFRHDTTSKSILAQEKVVLSRLSDSTARKLVNDERDRHDSQDTCSGASRGPQRGLGCTKFVPEMQIQGTKD